MEKIIKIRVCDCCQKEADRLWDFTIPWPSTIVASGGRGQIATVEFSEEEFCRKNIELCDECAIRFTKFLVNASKPEGVRFKWEKLK